MIRLDKLLSHAGFGSRTQVKELIKKGRVALDGAVCRDSSRNVELEAVTVDGKPVHVASSYHLMMYKPSGVVTAADDPKQKTVMDLLPEKYLKNGCMPVGRLDKDTTGLLILTTDGELAHRLISPKRHVQKIYEAATREALKQEDVSAFEKGIPLKNFTALPASLEIVEEHFARVTVFEGKYHQVKRMFLACGNEVVKLHRATFGPLQLDEHLAPGLFRELSDEEVDKLYLAAGLERKE